MNKWKVGHNQMQNLGKQSVSELNNKWMTTLLSYLIRIKR